MMTLPEIIEKNEKTIDKEFKQTIWTTISIRRENRNKLEVLKRERNKKTVDDVLTEILVK
jgi:hypothetical protein